MAYRLHARELVARLGTNEQSGLSEEEARARLAQYGPNELAAEEPVPAWRRFLSQFQDVLVILLLVATAISAALWVVERDAALPYEAIAPPWAMCRSRVPRLPLRHFAPCRRRMPP